jgi:hypothetical protein
MMHALKSVGMRKVFVALWLCILIVSTSHSQPLPIERRESLKLRQFLSEHPAAAKVLTNSIKKVFSNRTVDLFYFYSDDETEARAFHYYSSLIGMAKVIICVRENQLPFDEFSSLLFEILNSRNQARFVKLTADAKAGKVSRDEFARGILRSEFDAVQDTKASVIDLKLDKSTIAGSYFYTRLLNCPSKFDDFLSYSKKVSKRDVFKEYQEKYDELRKHSAK